MGKIKSVSIFAGNVEMCHCLGQNLVTQIEKEGIVIDGDICDHYVVYVRGEVKAKVRSAFVHEVTYELELS